MGHAYRTVAALATALAVGVAAPAVWAQPPAPVERGPSVAAVAFAVNVVWGTPYVVPLAQAFRQAGGHATFFLGGRWAQEHPDLARQLRDWGMELGSHGHRHRHVGHLSLQENLREIDDAQRAILDAAGVRPRLYAPAYGEVSPAVLKAAHQRGLTVILWTIDTVDWRPHHTPAIIQDRVLRRIMPGAIVLIHPTERTVQALPPLLAQLRRRGYRLLTVSQLLAQSPSPARRPAAASAGEDG